MRPWSHLVASIVLLAGSWTGCKQRDPAEERASTTVEQGASTALPSANMPELSRYGRDVERICYSEERSGALQRPEGERAMIVAQWLGDNIETDEGRSFMIKVAQASPAEKVAILEAEARTQGLTGCPLIQAWSAGLKN